MKDNPSKKLRKSRYFENKQVCFYVGSQKLDKTVINEGSKMYKITVPNTAEICFLYFLSMANIF